MYVVKEIKAKLCEFCGQRYAKRTQEYVKQWEARKNCRKACSARSLPKKVNSAKALEIYQRTRSFERTAEELDCSIKTVTNIIQSFGIECTKDIKIIDNDVYKRFLDAL